MHLMEKLHVSQVNAALANVMSVLAEHVEKFIVEWQRSKLPRLQAKASRTWKEIRGSEKFEYGSLTRYV